MRFLNPQALWLILLAPVSAAFFVWAAKSRRAAAERFLGRALVSEMTGSLDRPAARIRPLAWLGGLVVLAFALSGPQWGFKWDTMKRRGLDIVVAVDVSRSMNSEDLKPTRLSAAKREVKALIGELKGDRVGLVAFAGSSFLECPLTLDYQTAKLFVDELEPGFIPLGGTDIGGALRCALGAFEGQDKKHRVVILLTDGEDHRRRVDSAIAEAKEKGAVVFTVGVGRREGAPIPSGEKGGGFVKDAGGHVVLSKRDDKLLQRIALETGGKMGTLGAGESPLVEIYRSEVSRMEKKELESQRQKRFENRFQIFLAAAFMLFAAEAVMGQRRKIPGGAA